MGGKVSKRGRSKLNKSKSVEKFQRHASIISLPTAQIYGDNLEDEVIDIKKSFKSEPENEKDVDSKSSLKLTFEFSSQMENEFDNHLKSIKSDQVSYKKHRPLTQKLSGETIYYDLPLHEEEFYDACEFYDDEEKHKDKIILINTNLSRKVTFCDEEPTNYPSLNFRDMKQNVNKDQNYTSIKILLGDTIKKENILELENQKIEYEVKPESMTAQLDLVQEKQLDLSSDINAIEYKLDFSNVDNGHKKSINLETSKFKELPAEDTSMSIESKTKSDRDCLYSNEHHGGKCSNTTGYHNHLQNGNHHKFLDLDFSTNRESKTEQTVNELSVSVFLSLVKSSNKCLKITENNKPVATIHIDHDQTDAVHEHQCVPYVKELYQSNIIANDASENDVANLKNEYEDTEDYDSNQDTSNEIIEELYLVIKSINTLKLNIEETTNKDEIQTLYRSLMRLMLQNLHLHKTLKFQRLHASRIKMGIKFSKSSYDVGKVGQNVKSKEMVHKKENFLEKQLPDEVNETIIEEIISAVHKSDETPRLSKEEQRKEEDLIIAKVRGEILPNAALTPNAEEISNGKREIVVEESNNQTEDNCFSSSITTVQNILKSDTICEAQFDTAADVLEAAQENIDNNREKVTPDEKSLIIRQTTVEKINGELSVISKIENENQTNENDESDIKETLNSFPKEEEFIVTALAESDPNIEKTVNNVLISKMMPEKVEDKEEEISNEYKEDKCNNDNISKIQTFSEVTSDVDVNVSEISTKNRETETLKVESILNEIKGIEIKVNSMKEKILRFKGSSEDQEFKVLHEELVKNLIILDDIKRDNEEINDERKRIIKIIQQCLQNLEKNIEEVLQNQNKSDSE
ncbi:hypothetical protein FQA39_LY17063 [Lamprigera yunnana]|nr:hypothetical protein FQA39_LY17063 [Lamprigera yunnana]